MHNKGFGTTKRPTEREIATLKSLIRVRKDYWAACAYRDKLTFKYGKEYAIDEVIADDPQLFKDYRDIMPPDLRQKLDDIILPKAQEMMFQQFAEWGFTPGEDFSLGTQGGKSAVFIGSRLQDRMAAEGFDIASALKEYGVPADETDPVAQLNGHLGVPFTRNLIAALATEASTEDPKLTLLKIGYLHEGLTAANPQIEWTPVLIGGIIDHLGKDWGRRFTAAYSAAGEFFQASPDANDSDWYPLPDDGWWGILLARALELELRQAALEGGREEWTLGIEDCRKLHQVWRGERFTFLELADALEKATKEHREGNHP